LFLTGKTIEGKDWRSESRNRAEVFCIVSFSIRCRPQRGSRNDASRGLRRPINLASMVVMKLKSERRAHFGAPPPIAQAATVFEE
jgi:hypothetical protein